MFIYIPGCLYFLIGLAYDQFIMTVAGGSLLLPLAQLAVLMMYALSKN